MKNISFIGIGNMASGIIRGAINSGSGIITGENLILFDKNTSQYANFSDIGAVIAESVSDAVRLGDVIFLAVKPQNFDDVLSEIRESGVSLDDKLFVSIGAGVPTKAITRLLCKEVPVVRCMPNTPMQIGMGVTAVARNKFVSDDDYEYVCVIFASAGMVLRLDESQMNTIICVNGSSPAYFYYFIDSMVKSARAQGLDCDNLTEAICKTILGSVTMMINSGKTPEELIREVTSPNGTTERAMKELYAANVAESIDKAMRACTARAEEMSQSFN
jgi:pyrroline-5-carboxylate reductase